MADLIRWLWERFGFSDFFMAAFKTLVEEFVRYEI